MTDASTTASEPLRLGVLGAARISQIAIIDPAHATGTRLVAVAARHRSRGEEFALKHGFERVLDDYQALITYTTTSAHSIAVGMTVVVSGNAQASYNIAGAVSTVPSTTTFTIASAASAGAGAGGTAGVQGKAQIAGTSTTLECGSCHDPHGNNSYRILKPVGAATSGGATLYNAPVQLDTAVASADPFDPAKFQWKYTITGTPAADNKVNFVPGQNVTIVGFTNFSSAGALVTSVDTARFPSWFTIANQATGPATQTGATAASAASALPNVITAATSNVTTSANGTYITYTTQGNHGLVPGQKVTVAGVGDYATTPTYATGFNIARKVISAVPKPNQFTVTFAVPMGTTYTYRDKTTYLPSGGYVSGVPDALGVVSVASTSGAAGTMTYTTSLRHGLTAGQNVTVSGVDVGDYNVTGNIVAVPSATTFTVAGAGTATGAGGSVVVNNAVTPTVTNVAVSQNASTGNWEALYTLSAQSGLNIGQTVKIVGTGTSTYDVTGAISAITTGTPYKITLINSPVASAVNETGWTGGITLLTGGLNGSRTYATANYWRVDDHTYTGVANNAGNMGDSATAMTQVTSTQSGMIIDVSQWCSTCHTRYFAASGARKYNSGDAIFKFRHRSESSGEGNPNCLQCHVAHGSNAVMNGAASSTLTNPGGAASTASNDSRLLRMDNRGICAMCHTTQG